MLVYDMKIKEFVELRQYMRYVPWMLVPKLTDEEWKNVGR